MSITWLSMTSSRGVWRCIAVSDCQLLLLLLFINEPGWNKTIDHHFAHLHVWMWQADVCVFGVKWMVEWHLLLDGATTTAPSLAHTHTSLLGMGAEEPSLVLVLLAEADTGNHTMVRAQWQSSIICILVIYWWIMRKTRIFIRITSESSTYPVRRWRVSTII